MINKTSVDGAPPLLPAIEAFARIGIKRTAAYELLNSGRVPAVKLGAKTMVRAEDFAAFIANLPAYKPSAYEAA